MSECVVLRRVCPLLRGSPLEGGLFDRRETDDSRQKDDEDNRYPDPPP